MSKYQNDVINVHTNLSTAPKARLVVRGKTNLYLFAPRAITRWVFVFLCFPFCLINSQRGLLVHACVMFLNEMWISVELFFLFIGWFESMCLFVLWAEKGISISNLKLIKWRNEKKFQLKIVEKSLNVLEAKTSSETSSNYSRLHAFLWVIGLVGSRLNPSLQ